MEPDDIFADENLTSEPLDDLEEFERNQVFQDHEWDDETPLGHDIEDGGELLDE